ncbi:MAG: DUF5947 family protein [Acidimicrobiales bacterium]
MSRPDDGPLASLKRVRSMPRIKPGERCELCAKGIPEEHLHVVNIDTRELLCACQACYLLFIGGASGKIRAVPERYLALTGFSLTTSQWEALQVPVSVAFFFHNSRQTEVAAFYPSPAGATECLLPLGSWEDIVASHPILDELAPDVEAALVHVEDKVSECFVVPIDICYELVGVLRNQWRGFDGGPEAQAALGGFFDRVRSRARPVASGVVSSGALAAGEELHA